MINKRFEQYKLERELKRSGITVDVLRYEQNEYGEPIESEEPQKIGSLLCLYHEQSSYAQRMSDDGSTIRTVKMPMLLALYKDVQALDIRLGDVVRLSEGFKVVGWVNIQEWSIYADISLERLDDGIRDL